MTTFTKKGKFIAEDEKRRFDKFIGRKLEGADKSVEDDVDVDVEKLWHINKNDSKRDDFKFFLQTKIADFHYNEDDANGILIGCHKGDGVSWLSEKILDTSNAILEGNSYGNNVEIDIIKREKSEFPISSFFGGEKKLLNFAVKSNFIEDARSSLMKNVVLLLVTLMGVLTMTIPAFSNALNQIDMSISTFQWYLIIGFIIVAIIMYNSYDLIEKRRKNRKKEKKDFLDKLDDKKKDYTTFIDQVADRVDSVKDKRIVIVDDIASIDEYGFSQDVLLRYLEKHKDKKNKKIFWIIFSSDLSVAREIISKSSATFYELTLQLLDRSEKEKLCADFGYDKSNASLVTIKEICTGKLDKDAEQSLQNELSKLKETNLNLFNFLYLLILNNFPRDSEYKMKQLIEKIPPRKDEREKDVYMKKFFDSVPVANEVESYFEDDRIKKYYEYDKVQGKFSIHNNISRLIEHNPDLFDYCNKFRYGQGYWALTWYHANKDKKMPKLHFVQKISYHLQNADKGIDDVKVRTNLLDAHLFTAKCSLSYLQRNDVESILNNVLSLNIENIANIRTDKTIQLILEAFKNFDNLPDNRPRLEDLECEELYEFLKTKEISCAYSLLQNENYSSVSDYIISLLLEQYWERVFFLWIFHRTDDLSYSLMPEISAELTELNTYFTNYFEKGKDNFSPLRLSNLALYIWINYIRLLSSDKSIEVEQIIKNIELFLSCYNKTSVDISRDDVYQQTDIQESICFVVSITLLLLKEQDTDKKQELERVLQDLNAIFNEIKIDIKNYDKSIDNIMRFLLLHSLMWKNSGFSVRYSMLSIIRVQLFLFSYDKKTTVMQLIAKAKEISRTAEKIDNQNRLTALLRFSLYYLNNDFINDEYKSSFLFQQALSFTNKDKISNTQFEYLYFSIQKCWYHRSEKIKEILACFVRCSEGYFDKIVEKICESPRSYLPIRNCLSIFNDNDEISLHISNTEYTYLSFFSKILQQARLREEVDLEYAECIWENFKFQLLLPHEKQIKRREFEEFWQNKEEEFWQNEENTSLFGDALEQLFILDDSNVRDDTMSKAYNFLNNACILNYSVNLLIACYFCDGKRMKNTLDEEYTFILDNIIDFESDWEEAYGNLYTGLIHLYSTLCTHTKDTHYPNYNVYNKKYKHYQFLEKEKKVENFETKDYASFFYTLCEIFRYDLREYNDLSEVEKKLLQNGKVNGLLDSINADSVIFNGGISKKFLELCRLKSFGNIGREDVFKKLNRLAKQNINNLIQLIMDTDGNRRYFERIRELKNKSSVMLFDDEE